MVLRHKLGWDPDFIARDRWLWPLSRAAAALPASSDWPSHADLDAMYAQRVRDKSAVALRFAPIVPRAKGRGRGGDALRAEQLYDGWITLEHVVPTRGANWHDLLNALCFATWPRSKFALHRRQHRAQAVRLSAAATSLPPARTREQDALTLLDEGGLIVAALPDAAEQLSTAARTPLRASALAAYETTLRAACARGSAALVPFGHALYEHWVEGVACPGASAHLLSLPALGGDDETLLAKLDEALSRQLADPTRFCTPHEGMHVRLQHFEPAHPLQAGAR